VGHPNPSPDARIDFQKLEFPRVIVADEIHGAQAGILNAAKTSKALSIKSACRSVIP